MLVTLFGIAMDVRDVQWEKALLPMLVTVFGIETEVNIESSNADAPISVSTLPEAKVMLVALVAKKA